MTLLQTAPKKQELPKVRQQRALVRGINLRTNANVISPASFQARKAYMVSAYQEGKFLAEPDQRGKPRPNPMSDPAAMEGMMGMMKGNMAMMIPQTLIMGWINAFFSGFVISKCATCFCSVGRRTYRAASRSALLLYHRQQLKSYDACHIWGPATVSYSLANAVITSEITFPVNTTIQVDASVRRWYARSRRPVGVQFILVLSYALWTPTRLQLYPWK